MKEEFENFVIRMNKMGQHRVPFLFIIDYEMNMPLLFPLEEATKKGVLFSVGSMRNYTDGKHPDKPLLFTRLPIDYSTYKEAFDKVLLQIRRGNTFLLNMTFRTEIETNWSLMEIFEKSEAPYKLLFDDRFVLYSPECFVKIADGRITSCPMKGTIDAAIPDAAGIIAADGKEMAEHATIVDLIRNDLSMVARKVNVTRYRYLEEVITHDKTLLQVSSEISGILPAGYHSHLGTIIGKLLPAGSICGAPKESTLRIIRETENYSRGYYTGVFGVFDGRSLDSGVMIRFIEKEGDRMYFKSGGGITHFSDPEKEYRELIDKVYVATH